MSVKRQIDNTVADLNKATELLLEANVYLCGDKAEEAQSLLVNAIHFIGYAKTKLGE